MKSSLTGGGTGFAYDEVTLPGGQKILCHHPVKCKGRVCCIHNPSTHPMVNWPQHWRSDRSLMERICIHGVGHPDPDHLATLRLDEREWEAIHGCDGCCQSQPGDSTCAN